MFGHIFGRFLVEQKMLSQQKLDEVLDVQKRVQVKLGLIAVSESFYPESRRIKLTIGKLLKISVLATLRLKWAI